MHRAHPDPEAVKLYILLYMGDEFAKLHRQSFYMSVGLVKLHLQRIYVDVGLTKFHSQSIYRGGSIF